MYVKRHDMLHVHVHTGGLITCKALAAHDKNGRITKPKWFVIEETDENTFDQVYKYLP